MTGPNVLVKLGTHLTLIILRKYFQKCLLSLCFHHVKCFYLSIKGLLSYNVKSFALRLQVLKLFEATPVACGRGKYGKNLQFNITFKLKLYYC